MDTFKPSFLEQMVAVHGPCELLIRYFSFVEAAARERGVALTLRTDFDRLFALSRRHRDSWPPLSPIFNPEHNALDGETAFWIEGVDGRGETVAANAARLYDLGDRSLADELRSLRIFYDDPTPHVAAGEAVEVTAPSTARIHGRVTFAGALWVRPDYRRHGFAKIIPRLTRSYALTRWNTPVFWTYIDPALDAAGLTQTYGYSHSEDRISTHMPTWRGDYDVLFLSMSRATLIQNVADVLDGTRTGFSRSMETHIVNNSPTLAHQGISTRS
jgi:GNAT superfamily N-acetyltransferase